MSTPQKQAPVRRGRPVGSAGQYEERRGEVVEAAARLFAQKGYEATPVAEVAAQAGLTGRGALYHYIESKQDLLVEIAFSVLTPLYEHSARIAALSDETTVTRLRLISETFLLSIAAKPSHVWVYEHDYRFLHGAHLERFEEVRRALEDVVHGLMRTATEDGTFDEIEPRLATFAFFNLHNRTVQWYRPEGRWTAAHLAKEYCRIFFAGLRSSRRGSIDIEAAVLTFRERHPEWELDAPGVSASDP